RWAAAGPQAASGERHHDAAGWAPRRGSGTPEPFLLVIEPATGPQAAPAASRGLEAARGSVAVAGPTAKIYGGWGAPRAEKWGRGGGPGGGRGGAGRPPLPAKISGRNQLRIGNTTELKGASGRKEGAQTAVISAASIRMGSRPRTSPLHFGAK